MAERHHLDVPCMLDKNRFKCTLLASQNVHCVPSPTLAPLLRSFLFGLGGWVFAHPSGGISLLCCLCLCGYLLCFVGYLLCCSGPFVVRWGCSVGARGLLPRFIVALSCFDLSTCWFLSLPRVGFSDSGCWFFDGLSLKADALGGEHFSWFLVLLCEVCA